MRTLSLATVLVAALLGAATARAETSIYVGDTKEYAIAFKAEATQLYVLELAGETDCYYTEPYEDLGSGGFSAFPAPKLMRSSSEGLHADDLGVGSAWVRAQLGGDVVSGDFRYSESELSYHCDTGFAPKPFQASRYEPTGSGGVPASGERPVYYGSEASTEVFLRADGEEAFGIRGTFVPACRVGGGKKILRRHALFSEPVNSKLSEVGSFKKREVDWGQTRSGAHYREWISLSGSVGPEAVTGTYLRVRTVKPRRKAKRRCVTGPLPFRAVRYLPAPG